MLYSFHFINSSFGSQDERSNCVADVIKGYEVGGRGEGGWIEEAEKRELVEFWTPATGG